MLLRSSPFIRWTLPIHSVSRLPIQFAKQIEDLDSHLIGDVAVFGFLPFEGGAGVRLRNSRSGFGHGADRGAQCACTSSLASHLSAGLTLTT